MLELKLCATIPRLGIIFEMRKKYTKMEDFEKINSFLCVCACVHMYTSAYKYRCELGQLVGIGFLLPVCGSQGWNSQGWSSLSQLATLEKYSLARRTDVPMWCPTTTLCSTVAVCEGTEISCVRPSDVSPQNSAVSRKLGTICF